MALADRPRPIPLHQPHFKGNELDYLKHCLEMGAVSSTGTYIDQFRQALKDFTGAKHVVLTMNGTAALHLSLLLAGVHPHDEVLVPSATFIGTCNAIRYCQATPHFVDIDGNSLSVDAEKLAAYLAEIAHVKGDVCYNKNTGFVIRALLVMHTYGHPVDLAALQKICAKYHIQLIEDAAEALGSYYQGQHVGRFGALSMFSFNGNKIITTGGGGAIVTDNDELGERAQHLSTTAKIPHEWNFQHTEVGFNYRMPNINAAIGLAQLEQLPKILARKRQLAEQYLQAFEHLEEIEFVQEPSYAQSNYWLNAFKLAEPDVNLRDTILAATHEAGIATRPLWQLAHRTEMYADCPRMDLTQSEQLAASLIAIPSSPFSLV